MTKKSRTSIIDAECEGNDAREIRENAQVVLKGPRTVAAGLPLLSDDDVGRTAWAGRHRMAGEVVELAE